VAHLRRIHEIRMALLDLQEDKELAAILKAQELEMNRAAIETARENAAIRQGQMVRDEQRGIFDSLKRQAEGVFDALLVKSRSVFGAIGDAFKTAMLTAIKDVVTSQVARMLMQLFGGLRIGVAGGAAPSGVTALGAIAPIVGASGFGIPGIGPGGTAPTFPTGGGGFGSALGLAGLLPGLKSFLGIGGLSPAGGIGPTLPFGAMSLGQKLSSIASSPAALLGGGLLALAGLQRGGLSGLGMTTAGGALTGFKFGGPLGAAIGGAAGAVAGLFGLFRKSAEEKAREKIKATYGVDIKDKGVLRQIVEIAKQGFGGNLDMAIRTPQIRDLIELYAMTTGQSTHGLPAKMRPVSLVQTDGSLFQQPGFSQGSLLPSLGGLSTIGLDRIGAGRPANAGPMVINITVPGAKEFFEKETVRVVVENPRAVQSAAMNAIRANSNRRELTSLQLSPGTLTS